MLIAVGEIHRPIHEGGLHISAFFCPRRSASHLSTAARAFSISSFSSISLDDVANSFPYTILVAAKHGFTRNYLSWPLSLWALNFFNKNCTHQKKVVYALNVLWPTLHPFSLSRLWWDLQSSDRGGVQSGLEGNFPCKISGISMEISGDFLEIFRKWRSSGPSSQTWKFINYGFCPNTRSSTLVQTLPLLCWAGAKIVGGFGEGKLLLLELE